MTFQDIDDVIREDVNQANYNNDSEFRYWLAKGVWEIAEQLAIANSTKEAR